MLPPGTGIGVTIGASSMMNPRLHPNPAEFVNRRFLGSTAVPLRICPVPVGALAVLGAAFATLRDEAAVLATHAESPTSSRLVDRDVGAVSGGT